MGNCQPSVHFRPEYNAVFLIPQVFFDSLIITRMPFLPINCLVISPHQSMLTSLEVFKEGASSSTNRLPPLTCSHLVSDQGLPFSHMRSSSTISTSAIKWETLRVRKFLSKETLRSSILAPHSVRQDISWCTSDRAMYCS